MKDLIDQDRPLPLGLAKLAINIVGLAFLISAIAIILLGFSTLLGGNFLPGIVQIFGGPALLLAVYFLLRLLLEHLMASHRLNDRITILGDALSADRQDR